jgi:predicted DNA-binding transcriptional regulator AlpA
MTALATDQVHETASVTASAKKSNGAAPLLLDVKAASELIGVSPTTLWRLASKLPLLKPVYPTERSARWRREDLEKYVRGLSHGSKRRRRVGAAVQVTDGQG